jgi:hypothetical protein
MAADDPFRTVDSKAGRSGRQEGNMHHLSQPSPAAAARPRHRGRTRVIGMLVALVTIGALTAGVGASASASADGPRRDLVSEVRHATRQFHSVTAVKHAGYARFTDVNGITCINGAPGQGNMGIHYVNGDLVGDGAIDADHPEAVLYEHTAGGMQITAVEYIVPVAAWQGAQPPELAGHQFMLITAPNRFGLPDFYALHVWVWKHNPHGTYNPWNPDVHCPLVG